MKQSEKPEKWGKKKEDIMTVIRRMEGEAIAKKMCEDTMSRESFQQLKMYMMG